MQALPDSDLVAASCGGEVDAFAQLVDRYQGLVCAISFSATGDRALSEDVAQETFVAAWRGLDGIREPAKVRAWLCQTARNLSRKALRRRGREVPRGDVTETIESTAPPAPTPLDQIMERESEELVWQTLERIPATYREPLVLFYRHGKSAREVAAALGLGEDAVHQRLSRGRKYLEDGVAALVERTLERTKPSRSLAAGVVAAIAAGTAGVAEAGAAQATAGATATTTTKAVIAAGGAWTMKTKIAAGAALAVLFVAGGAALVRSGSDDADRGEHAAAPAIDRAAPGEDPEADRGEPAALPRPPSDSAEPPDPSGPERGVAEKDDDGGVRYSRFEVEGDDGRLWYKLFSGVPECTAKVSAPAGDDEVHAYRVRLRFEPLANGGGTRLRAATVLSAPEGATGLRELERCLIDAHAGVAFPKDRREAILAFSHPAAPEAGDRDPDPAVDRELIEALPVEVGFARGPDDAPVTIVVYTDFQCVYCTRALATMDELLEEYPEDLRVVTKLFPLKPSSRRLAEATVAASEQGAFWPMHDLIFAHQDHAGLGDDDLRGFAEQIGIDVPAFLRALDSADVAAMVQADIDEGRALGVRGTPTMLVEGDKVVGAQPIDVFRELIDSHLSN